jgi:hypothetical protein
LQSTSKLSRLPLVVGAWLTLSFALASGQTLSFLEKGSDHGRFGNSIATIADIDLDGVEDVLVGEPDFSTATAADLGRLSIYSGRTGVLLRTHVGEAGIQLGFSVAAADDVDGDGVGDYLAGAPGANGNAGGVVMLSGATGTALWFFTSNFTGSFQGKSVSRIGDFDGDGVEDIAVGTPDKARVELVNGVTGGSIIEFSTGDSTTRFGAALAVCDDLDHDGARDFLVGLPDNSDPAHGLTHNGAVLAFSTRAFQSLGSWFGDASFDNFGSSVATVLDVNRDGVNDIVIGAPRSRAPGFQSGLVRLISGKDLTVLHDTFGNSGEFLGFSVAGLRDMNHDGVPDYVAGSPSSPSGTGVAAVISGRDGRVMFRFAGVPQRNQELGEAVAGGDCNQDGIADVIVADPSARFSGSQTGSVAVFLGCPAFVDTYGTGFPGKLGVPQLTSTAPALGKTVATTVFNSLGTTTMGALLLGFAPANITTPSGATLLVLPALAITLSIPAGGATFGGPIPPDPALAFVDLYEQVIELDPFAHGGESFTPGLHLRIGFDL